MMKSSSPKAVLIRGGDTVPPGTFRGGDTVPPGTFRGGDTVPPGTFRGMMLCGVMAAYEAELSRMPPERSRGKRFLVRARRTPSGLVRT